MALLPKREPVHTGTERYEITLAYSPDEVEDIRRLTKPGHIVVDTVVLVWERRVGGEWARVTSASGGSCVTGHQRLDATAEAMGAQGQRGTRSIFTGGVGSLQKWADLLPGLRNAVEAAELGLPG